MLNVDIPLDLPARSRAPGGSLADWWRSLPGALRAPVWPGALAALLILGLLLGFHQVVRDAVRQGEALRMTAASRAEAVWRCNTLTRTRLRVDCLARVDTPPPTRAESAPPPNTAALAAAAIGQ
jgi:hypothetical protein